MPLALANLYMTVYVLFEAGSTSAPVEISSSASIRAEQV